MNRRNMVNAHDMRSETALQDALFAEAAADRGPHSEMARDLESMAEVIHTKTKEHVAEFAYSVAEGNFMIASYLAEQKLAQITAHIAAYKALDKASRAVRKLR